VFLRDPAAARRRLAVKNCIFADMSYVDPDRPKGRLGALFEGGTTSLIILRRPSSWRGGWLGSSRPA